MTQSLHAIVWYLFIIWLQNLMRAMHVYLTSTSSMCKTRKLEYQWHATQCLSYSSWSHVAHVEALSRPPCVDWSQWRAAGSRRMYSSSLSHTGGTCTKRRCARTPCTHSFLACTRGYMDGHNFVPRSTPCDNLTRVKSFTSLMVN